VWDYIPLHPAAIIGFESEKPSKQGEKLTKIYLKTGLVLFDYRAWLSELVDLLNLRLVFKCYVRSLGSQWRPSRR